MRNFLKTMLAVICGFALITMIFVFIVLGILGTSMSTPSVSIKPNSIFVIELNGTVQERSNDLSNYTSLFNSNDVKYIGLDDILDAIATASTDNNIKGIYLKCGVLSAPPASISEIRDALIRFKETGKFITAYADNYSQSAYQIASLADKVYMNPEGILQITGYHIQTIFFKDLLEKVGVEMQVVKVGTYKSAVEPYILNKMSDANREQNFEMAKSLWNKFLLEVSNSRKINTEKINEFADKGITFSEAIQSVNYGLIDSLVYEMDVDALLAQKMECEEDDLQFCSLKDLKNLQKNIDYQKNKIAVVYASGAIDSGNNNEENIDSEKLSATLRSIAKDENIKAVVLRVNSPGGSAFGSEQIWYALNKVKANKPLIVSMGGYAASGGYYISCIADTIVAQPNTITGSIGIFGLIPNAQGLVNKLGLSFDGVKTNEMSNFGELFRPMSEQERSLMQGKVNRGYELFVKRCADGRSMSIDAIKSIAEGRVWTGEQALENGLVDTLGNLNDALAIAIEKSGVEEYEVVSYPEKKDLLTQILEEFSSSQMQIHSLTNYSKYINYFDGLINGNAVQARMPYFLVIK
ncbi:MAG: signal peptide peptidase SppA [Paludibacteraceae bacterium]|nr:signal peptide peptidase SppA [Paludibacteraceae bacterium]